MKRLSLVLIVFMCFMLCSCSFDLTPEKCDHEFEETIIESTCTVPGKIIKRCIKCGYTEETELELKDHTFKESVIEPTCEHEGYTLRVCSVCGFEEKVNIVPKLEHNLELVEVIKPTCKEEGYSIYKCLNCGEIIKKDFTEKIGHEFNEEIIAATCTEEGQIIRTCKTCGLQEVEIIPDLGHNYGEWKIIKNPTAKESGLKERVCSRCNKKEQVIIPKLEYVNLDHFKNNFNQDEIYMCNSMSELQNIFSTCILHMSSILKVNIRFNVDNYNQLLQDLVDNNDVPFSYSVNASITKDKVTFNFKYTNIPDRTSPNIRFTQYKSVNYNPCNKTRSDTFDNFKINNSEYSMEVKESDQLYYCLEHGVKPIPVKGSMAEKILEIAKNILRHIITDDMNDLEKVKAIHDFLIMDVTYDEDLLDYMYNNTEDLSKYNGFYLEGVFLDHKAVCEGISKAFTVLCNLEGIPCVSVVGLQTNNPQGAGHAWNKVNLDGIWYVIDTTSDGTIINSEFEVLSYEYFLIDEASFSKKYTATNYLELVAENNLSYFDKNYFTYQNNKYDFDITTQKELNIIIKYFKNINLNKISIQFKISFDTGLSSKDELDQAFLLAGIPLGYRYLEENNIYTLIK